MTWPMTTNGLERLLDTANKLLERKFEPEKALREASNRVVSSVVYGPLLLKLGYLRLGASEGKTYFEIASSADKIPKAVSQVAAQYLYEKLRKRGKEYLRGKKSFRAKDIADNIFTPVVISQTISYLVKQGVVEVCDWRSNKAFYRITHPIKFKRVSYANIRLQRR